MTTDPAGSDTITIYSTSWCPWCDRAKQLLDGKRLPYEEVDIETAFSEPREELERLTGRRSVPQIVVGSTHIGGFDDLAALEADGALDALTAAEGIAADG